VARSLVPSLAHGLLRLRLARGRGRFGLLSWIIITRKRRRKRRRRIIIIIIVIIAVGIERFQRPL